MTIPNRLKLISLLPILIMIALASYPLPDIYANFDINNQNQLIMLGIYGSIILLGVILLIYGYNTLHHESKNTTELAAIFDEKSDIYNLNLDTYEGRSEVYGKLIKNKAMIAEIGVYLDIIIAFAELVKTTDIDEEQQEFISIIEKSSENIFVIINNILEKSKDQSNEVSSENIIFDTFEEFEGILKIYAANAAGKNIDLNFFIDPRISPKLNGDLDKIKKIMINLLDNAIEFTNQHGEINVEIKKINEEFHENIVTGTLLIKIQDNGIGMSQEQQEYIFDAFSQAGISEIGEYDKKNLGLVESNRFAHLINGKLDVESAQDVGTAFYLTFPIDEVTIENSSMEDAYLGIMAGIYENDDMPSRSTDYIKKYLKFFGIKVKTFQSINKLNSLIEKNKCKFCFIDTDNAESEIIEALGKADKNKLIAMCRSANIDKLQQLGFDNQNILLKPVSLSGIKEVLSRAKDTNDADRVSIEDEANINDEKICDILIAKTIDLENKIIAKMAQNRGYTTMISNDLEFLSDALKNGKFDIVITDEEIIKNIDIDINENVVLITGNAFEEIKSKK